jgi:hypothetical protein
MDRSIHPHTNARVDIKNVEKKQHNITTYLRHRRRLHLKVQYIVSQWDYWVKQVTPIGSFDNHEILDKKTSTRRTAFIGTLIYGCIATLYMFVLQNWIQPQPIMTRLSIWLGLGGYGILFFHWYERPYIKLILPLWIVFSAAWISMPVLHYIFWVNGFLVWIRSDSLSYNPAFFKVLGFDFLSSYMGMGLVVWLASVNENALISAVLIFFTFQAILVFISPGLRSI